MAEEPERAKIIFVHRNGEPYEDKYGMRMVVHPRKTRNYEQLKNEMTSRVRLNTGAVRHVFNAATGVEILKLDEFEGGIHYVCCSTDRVKITSLAKGATPRRSPKPKSILAAPTPSPERAKVVMIFRNGDRHHEGKRYVISKKRYQNMEQLFEDLSKNVGVNTGAVRRLVSTTDIKADIEKIDDIVDAGRYICLGGEHRVDIKNLPQALKAEVKAKATPGGSGRKSTGKKAEMFGLQTDKGRVIWAYANGDKHHKGTKFVIHHKKFKTMDQLRLTMSNKMKLPTGPVMKVLHYSSENVKPVNSLEDFVDEGHYVVCGAEKFNRTAISTTLKEKAAASATPSATTDDEFLNPPASSSSTSSSGPLDPVPTSAKAEEPETAQAPEPEPEPEPVVAEPEPEPVVAEPEPEPEPEVQREPAVVEPEVVAEPEEAVADIGEEAAVAPAEASEGLSDDDMF